MKKKKPKVLNNVVTCYDCDDTLVRWIWDENEKEELKDKLVKFDTGGTGYNLQYVWLQPNDEVIENLKQNALTGGSIVVWSAGGDVWAKTVIETLKLEQYVDVIMSKPTKYVDDLPCDEWMGKWVRVKKDGSLHNLIAIKE